MTQKAKQFKPGDEVMVLSSSNYHALNSGDIGIVTNTSGDIAIIKVAQPDRSFIVNCILMEELELCSK